MFIPLQTAVDGQIINPGSFKLIAEDYDTLIQRGVIRFCKPEPEFFTLGVIEW